MTKHSHITSTEERSGELTIVNFFPMGLAAKSLRDELAPRFKPRDAGLSDGRQGTPSPGSSMLSPTEAGLKDEAGDRLKAQIQGRVDLESKFRFKLRQLSIDSSEFQPVLDDAARERQLANQPGWDRVEQMHKHYSEAHQNHVFFAAQNDLHKRPAPTYHHHHGRYYLTAAVLVIVDSAATIISLTQASSNGIVSGLGGLVMGVVTFLLGAFAGLALRETQHVSKGRRQRGLIGLILLGVAIVLFQLYFAALRHALAVQDSATLSAGSLGLVHNPLVGLDSPQALGIFAIGLAAAFFAGHKTIQTFGTYPGFRDRDMARHQARADFLAAKAAYHDAQSAISTATLTKIEDRVRLAKERTKESKTVWDDAVVQTHALSQSAEVVMDVVNGLAEVYRSAWRETAPKGGGEPATFAQPLVTQVPAFGPSTDLHNTLAEIEADAARVCAMGAEARSQVIQAEKKLIANLDATFRDLEKNLHVQTQKALSDGERPL